MANENSKRDENRVTTALGITDDANVEIRKLLVDPITGRLLITITPTSDTTPVQNKAGRDENRIVSGQAVTDDANADVKALLIDNLTGFLFIDKIDG